MVRIGQLTDIHVAEFSGLRRRDFMGKRASGWVNFTRKRSKEYERRVVDAAVARMVEAAPDVVVVSGDLSNLGLASELRAALEVLEPLRAAGIRTVVIPGNHDAYTTAAAGGQFERVCAEWQIADARADGGLYPFVVRVDEVAIVCFNSAIPTPTFMAYGRVEDAQIARARELVAIEHAAGRSVVFALHHHPTRAPHHRSERGRGLRNVAAFRALAAESSASLVFHGHNHFMHLRRLREAPDVNVVGISSATTNRLSPAERVAQVGLFEVTGDGLQRVGISSWDGGKFAAWAWTEPSDITIESEHEQLTSG